MQGCASQSMWEWSERCEFAYPEGFSTCAAVQRLIWRAALHACCEHIDYKIGSQNLRDCLHQNYRYTVPPTGNQLKSVDCYLSTSIYTGFNLFCFLNVDTYLVPTTTTTTRKTALTLRTLPPSPSDDSSRSDRSSAN
jgi:hypothetical protein